MKKVFLLLLVCATFYACKSTEEKDKGKNSRPNDSTNTKEILRDTITFSVEPIDEKSYCKLTSQMGFCNARLTNEWISDSLLEIKLLKENKNLIRRDGYDLIVIAKSGEIRLKDNTDEESGDYLSYKLIEVNGAYITLTLFYYESSEFMVINTENGKSFKTWGKPVFNQNKTMVVAGNSDLFAGFTNNGIQLFEQDSTGWNLKMQKILDDWGPVNLFWLNDSSILSKKNSIDESDTIDGVKTEFVKITLKKEKLN